MSLLPRALLVNDPLSPLGKLVVPSAPCEQSEEEWFEGRIQVAHIDGKAVWIEEADCRQHKSNGTAQQPVPQVLPPSSPEAQGAVAVPPKFKKGDRVEIVAKHFCIAIGETATVREVDCDGDLWVDTDVPRTQPGPRGICVGAAKARHIPSKPTEDSEGALENGCFYYTKRKSNGDEYWRLWSGGAWRGSNESLAILLEFGAERIATYSRAGNQDDIVVVRRATEADLVKQ